MRQLKLYADRIKNRGGEGMAKQLSEDEIYEEARRRVKAKRDFYGHFAAYVVVNIILVIVWAFSSPGGYPWFLWPLGMWGVFVLWHFLDVFVLHTGIFFERRSDKGAIEKEADKIRKEQS